MHAREQKQPQKIVTARVFSHGTILAGCFFIDIPASWKDNYKENSLIERAMASARKHPFLHQTELVLDLGLVDVTQEVMVPLCHPLRDDRAAISIMRSFERTDRCIGKRHHAYHYYTFGWSGALSERKRNKESVYLYHALVGLKNDLQQQYPDATIRFEIFCHSHGGQLVAHLATVHKQFPINDIFIDLAVLCATPLYKEKMQPMVSSSLFGTIINLYSQGDHVQTLDVVSTPEHYCVRTFQELQIPLARGCTNGPRVLDICLGVHGNKKVFGHHHFFSCSLYSIPSYFHKRSHIRRTLNLFEPLPLLALFPAYLESISSLDLPSGYHALHIDFKKHHGHLILETHYKLFNDASFELKNVQCYTVKPLSFEFVKEYKHRARTSAMNQFKYTFYHIIHS
jgi:hypothetical protein